MEILMTAPEKAYFLRLIKNNCPEEIYKNFLKIFDNKKLILLI
jgi:hypothetical protein